MTPDLMGANRYLVTKRALDFTAAGILLVLLSPMLGVIAIIVRVRLGSPVIFTQKRPGRDEEVFTLYKFRTMAVPNPARGLVSDLERMTPFGQILRSASLDELPSLWNIFKGEMSFVGPRPLLVAYLPRYSPQQRKRHVMCPGLTGLAQVNGRNLLAWDDRLCLDVEYVARVSFRLDVWILLRTVAVVLRKTGISQSPEMPMEEFFGPMAFSTLELNPAYGNQVMQGVGMMPGVEEPQDIEMMPGFICGEDQHWLTQGSSDSGCYKWVALDPVSSTILAVCGVRVMDEQVADHHVADLHVAVLQAGGDEAEVIGFQTLSMVTARALALGVGQLRVTCTKTNGLMMVLLLKFGFEIIESAVQSTAVQSSSYLLSFETNLGHCDDN